MPCHVALYRPLGSPRRHLATGRHTNPTCAAMWSCTALGPCPDSSRPQAGMDPTCAGMWPCNAFGPCPDSSRPQARVDPHMRRYVAPTARPPGPGPGWLEARAGWHRRLWRWRQGTPNAQSRSGNARRYRLSPAVWTAPPRQHKTDTAGQNRFLRPCGRASSGERKTGNARPRRPALSDHWHPQNKAVLVLPKLPRSSRRFPPAKKNPRRSSKEIVGGPPGDLREETIPPWRTPALTHADDNMPMYIRTSSKHDIKQLGYSHLVSPIQTMVGRR
jgi:hypothetical protein